VTPAQSGEDGSSEAECAHENVRPKNCEDGYIGPLSEEKFLLLKRVLTYEIEKG